MFGKQRCFVMLTETKTVNEIQDYAAKTGILTRRNHGNRYIS